MERKSSGMEKKGKDVARKGSIVVICAHSDDQIFGLGGAMAKYAKEGWDIYTIVFSFGEKSHPHFKPREIRKIRIEESVRANKIIGGKQVVFLGLGEGHLEEEYLKKKGKERITHLLRLYKPDKIFTHAPDDPHYDHRAVFKIVSKTMTSLKLDCTLYSFTVWNFFSFRKDARPKLVVDISGTFSKKVAALKCFRSQINFFSYVLFNNILYLSVFVKAVFFGIRHGVKYAEVFSVEN
jgi:LmbE family N-acetylglucosaminyl deacetylase